MKNNIRKKIKTTKGFTLVEILVVIIVISVLSSIAVVQYQKSVLKSQFATLLPIAKALHESEELFAMSRGNYTDRLENLDASAGASGNTANINGSIVSLGVNKKHAYVKATKENFDNNLIMFQKGSFYFPGEIHCEAKEDKTLANWLCQKELGGTKLERSLTEGYTDYVIQGDGNGFFPKDWVNVSGSSWAKLLELSNGDTCTGTEYQECSHLKVSDGSCYGKAEQSCTKSSYINSYCEGSEKLACSRYTEFYNSSCLGTGKASCHGGEFYDSSCEGKNSIACAGSTFDNSVCIGNWGTACAYSTFKNGSICYANVKGACGDSIEGNNNSTYEDTSCCIGECPGYAPKCDCGIDSSTGQHALSC